MRLIRPYDDPSRDEHSPPTLDAAEPGDIVQVDPDRFLTPAEQRRALDTDAGPLWVAVGIGVAVLAILYGFLHWVG